MSRLNPGNVPTCARKVGEIARTLEKSGYQVRASVGRRPRPHAIGSQRLMPDIEAVRAGHTQIIKVETPLTLRDNATKVKGFAKYARSVNITFKLVLTKPRNLQHSSRLSSQSRKAK